MSLEYRQVIGLALFLAFSSSAVAITKCIGADGSVSYVQGDCPDLQQERESVEIWDSDAKNHNPSSTMVPSASQSNSISGGPGPAGSSQRRPINNGRSGNPCNYSGSNPVEARMNSQACETLRQSGGSQSSACRRLASGTERMSPPEYRALMAQCRASRN